MNLSEAVKLAKDVRAHYEHPSWQSPTHDALLALLAFAERQHKELDALLDILDQPNESHYELSAEARAAGLGEP